MAASVLGERAGQWLVVHDGEPRHGAGQHDVEPAQAGPHVGLVTGDPGGFHDDDAVVLCEPAAIVDAEPTRASGLRRLYVVLTRAVSHLVVLHDLPLPPELVDRAEASP